MAKTRIGILFGGRSSEHEVSLNSARFVLSVLDPQKYQVVLIGITHDGRWLSGDNALDAFVEGRTENLLPVTILPEPGRKTLFTLQGKNGSSGLTPLIDLDVVFPVLHGTFGEDGTVQALLKTAGIPFVGAGVAASALGMDKDLFKHVLVANQIPVLPWIVVTRRQIKEDLQGVFAQAEALGPYPLFTKPANLGSSVGITKCSNRNDLYEGLLDAARYDRRVLIEVGLERPREIEVSVLGNDQPQASLPGEVIPAADFYSYDAKYVDDRSELLIPARLPSDTIEEVRALAVRIFKVMDSAGMARVDFLLDRKTNALYASEVNTIPGFTRISMYPKLWEASGLPGPALVERLIELAFERQSERDRTEYRYKRS